MSKKYYYYFKIENKWVFRIFVFLKLDGVFLKIPNFPCVDLNLIYNNL